MSKTTTDFYAETLSSRHAALILEGVDLPNDAPKGTRRVLGVLAARYYSGSAGRGFTRITASKLADRAEVARGRVPAILEYLTALGYITEDETYGRRRGTKGGGPLPRLFRFTAGYVLAGLALDYNADDTPFVTKAWRSQLEAVTLKAVGSEDRITVAEYLAVEATPSPVVAPETPAFAPTAPVDAVDVFADLDASNAPVDDDSEPTVEEDHGHAPYWDDRRPEELANDALETYSRGLFQQDRADAPATVETPETVAVAAPVDAAFEDLAAAVEAVYGDGLASALRKDPARGKTLAALAEMEAEHGVTPEERRATLVAVFGATRERMRIQPTKSGVAGYLTRFGFDSDTVALTLDCLANEARANSSLWRDNADSTPEYTPEAVERVESDDASPWGEAWLAAPWNNMNGPGDETEAAA